MKPIMNLGQQTNYDDYKLTKQDSLNQMQAAVLVPFLTQNRLMTNQQRQSWLQAYNCQFHDRMVQYARHIMQLDVTRQDDLPTLWQQLTEAPLDRDLPNNLHPQDWTIDNLTAENVQWFLALTNAIYPGIHGTAYHLNRCWYFTNGLTPLLQHNTHLGYQIDLGSGDPTTYWDHLPSNVPLNARYQVKHWRIQTKHDWMEMMIKLAPAANEATLTDLILTTYDEWQPQTESLSQAMRRVVRQWQND